MSDPEESVSGEASPDGEADPTGRPVGHRAWRRRVPAIVAVAVTLAAVVLAVTQTVRADDARDALADYAGARGAASAFGEAYLSYDAADVAGSSERVLSLATDRFAEEFEENRSPAIEALFDEIGTNTQATTTEVFVTEVSGGRARALVVVDVKASSAETPDQTLVDLTFVLDLVRVGSHWKVDAVSPAPRPDVVGGDEGTTATTVPEGQAPSPAPTASAPAPTPTG